MKTLSWAPEFEIPIPENENERLTQLEEYENNFDDNMGATFDRLAKIAAEICNTPISQINIHNKDKQIVKAAFGIEKRNTPREESFCQFTLMSNEVTEVEDAKNDILFHSNPFVIGDFNLQFYAGVPLRSPSGHNIGALCILDHKPNKLNEFQKSALQTLAQEIINQYELNLVRKKLEQLNKEKDEMIRLLSHDIRNPLSGILGASELLSMEMHDERILPLVEIIHNSGHKLLEVINVSLNSEYIKMHGFSFNKEAVNLVYLIDEVLELHQASAFVKKIRLNFTSSEPNLSFILDADKFKQIVGNLVSNAIKFSFPKSIINISISLDFQKNLVLVVQDEGIGMPSEIKRHLFDGKVETLRNGTFNEPTSGIGMPYIKQFVDLHDGKIEVYTEEGRRTVFTVTFPT